MHYWHRDWDSIILGSEIWNHFKNLTGVYNITKEPKCLTVEEVPSALVVALAKVGSIEADLKQKKMAFKNEVYFSILDKNIKVKQSGESTWLRFRFPQQLPISIMCLFVKKY